MPATRRSPSHKRVRGLGLAELFRADPRVGAEAFRGTRAATGHLSPVERPAAEGTEAPAENPFFPERAQRKNA
jgi:hypothetical protein